MGPARTARWWPRLATLVVVATLTTSCGEDHGPLTLAGYGNVLDGDRRPAYFVLDACLADEAAEIRIVDVTATSVQGTTEPLEFKVAWGDGPEFSRVISDHRPLPDAYVDAKDAEGRVGRCDESGEYAAIAVVFPSVGRRPVAVDGIEVTYEADGDEYTSSADTFLAQCPYGTRARPTAGERYRGLCTRAARAS